MPSVVIIHAAEDSLPARALAEKLRAAKLTPMIDLTPGDALRQAVRDAGLTLALWSPRSISQAALIDEVNFAKTKGNVVHAQMQNVQAPEAFRTETCINLTGWRGEDDFKAWRDLAKVMTKLAGVPDLPPLAPKPPSGPAGFFQPGAAGAVPASGTRGQQQQRQQPPRQQQQQPRAPQAPRQTPPPPPARAPRPQQAAEPKGGGGLPVVPVVIALVIAVAGVGGYFVWNNMQGSQAASSAWESVARNDASALRAFIDDDPGAFREEAQQALAALEEQTFDAAREEDTIDAFEGFLNDFPDSDHAIEARGRIAELQSLPPEEEAAEELAPDETTPIDPDLLPPAAAETAPDDAGAGPAALTPPAAEPAPEPEPAGPTN